MQFFPPIVVTRVDYGPKKINRERVNGAERMKNTEIDAGDISKQFRNNLPVNERKMKMLQLFNQADSDLLKLLCLHSVVFAFSLVFFLRICRDFQHNVILNYHRIRFFFQTI